jgi:hypothetical protein
MSKKAIQNSKYAMPLRQSCCSYMHTKRGVSLSCRVSSWWGRSCSHFLRHHACVCNAYACKAICDTNISGCSAITCWPPCELDQLSSCKYETKSKILTQVGLCGRSVAYLPVSNRVKAIMCSQNLVYVYVRTVHACRLTTSRLSPFLRAALYVEFMYDVLVVGNNHELAGTAPTPICTGTLKYVTILLPCYSEIRYNVHVLVVMLPWGSVPEAQPNSNSK